MAEQTFNINQKDVYDDVSKITAYTGKKAEAEGAYERMYATEIDLGQLNRYWEDAKTSMCSALKKMFAGATKENTMLTLKLNVTSGFDSALSASITDGLFSYFVTYICSKWFALIDANEAARYKQEAEGHLDEVKRKLCYKKRPSRPQYQT